MNDNQIFHINVEGFKSIKKCDLKLNNLNVLIGGNGVGKSNFINLFKMLQRILDKELGVYVGEQGLNTLLYNGRKITNEISVIFGFGKNGYGFQLIPTEDERLIFKNEWFYGETAGPRVIHSGHSESKWNKGTGNRIDEFVKPILQKQKWRVYHFHDTSKNAPVKQAHAINDNIQFATDARNIAAFLYRLQKKEESDYQRIVTSIRLVAPFFEDFILRPNPLNEEIIRLEWKAYGSDIPFNVSQLSDGMIRFICLAVLLLQPNHLQPETIIIDEPELGLHPAAIVVLASIIRKVSKRKQIIISTQSVELLNEFEIEDIIVVDRKENASCFRRLEEEELKVWLEDEYSVGDLWKKNLIGGRPAK
jgi:predicted ATPase